MHVTLFMNVQHRKEKEKGYLIGKTRQNKPGMNRCYPDEIDISFPELILHYHMPLHFRTEGHEDAG